MAKTMAVDEYELLNDAKYRSFVAQVDKALKGFEYTTEWADLVNALGKLNKVLQNNTKYPVIPRKVVVGQRLAQCMHPALPSGVHLKALETYDLIFRCIGTDRLVQELSIYSNGLFPLLSHAAINVKPTLLEVYETHFVPLGERLRPALDGFLIAVLPGLEEGSDYHPTTENLLKKVCEGVSKDFFYGSIWRCILYNPSVRLPAVSFVISQFNKKKSLEDQLYVMGTNIETLVNGVCTALLDPNVLVQRAILDLLLCCLPMHNSQMLKEDMISITTAAVTVLLRRDISLNRRLYSWFFGMETSVGTTATRDVKKIATSSGMSGGSRTKRKKEEYFEKYAKELVLQAFVLCLKNPSRSISSPTAWLSLGELWPYRLLICLLDSQEIRQSLVESLSTQVFRALYLDSRVDKVSQDMRRTTNLLLSNLGIAYTWDRLCKLLSEACALSCSRAEGKSQELDATTSTPSYPVQAVGSGPVTLLEICAITDYMIEMTALDNYPETCAVHLPRAFNEIIENTTANCRLLQIDELNATIQLATKIVSKIHPATDTKATDWKNVEADPPSLLLQGIKEETASMMSTSDRQSELDFRTPDSEEIKLPSLSPEEKVRPEATTVQGLFETFVRERLVEANDLLKTCYENLSKLEDNEAVRLDVCLDMVPVYSNLCQLLLKVTLMLKRRTDTEKSNSEDSDFGTDKVPIWLRYMLVLACYARNSSVAVSYCSTSTYLALVSIRKAMMLDLPLPSITITPSSSPVLDFNHSASDSISSELVVEPILTADQLNFIYNETSFYTTVTQLLWDNLGDDNCDLHLETAGLLQQIHNLAEDSATCESVICNAMASSDEAISYEARKRFCTLYNITRDLKQNAAPFHRREFDRPLFFMLDSLTHKLDAHNAQAVDWLNQCLKNGDVARILEPLLFILLHPDTGRVSVQHVNIHQPEVSEPVSGKSDEADNAALAAAEARIYAISSTGGNVIYHVNPEGRKRFSSSPVPPQKVLALTSQNNHAKASTSKWITSRFNLPDYEVPPSHEQNIISGKYLSINMVMNPFGSQSSLTSDALESLDTSSVTFAPSHPDLSSIKRFDMRRYTKSADDVRKTPTPSLATATPTPSTTPLPSHLPRMLTGDSDSLSDSEIVSNVVEELVEAVVDRLEEDEGSESSSSSNSATNTRQTMSESISMNSWVKPVSVNQLHSHILLYTQVYDSRRTLYALTTLWNIILTDPQQVLFSLTTTSISNRLGFRSQELQSLCARHRKSLFGRGFYSELDTEAVTAFRSSSFLEIIVTTCLYYARSYYPGLPQTRLNEDEVLGNQKVRILSCEILRLIFGELVTIIKRSPMLSCYMHDMLMRCKVQKVVLHSVVSSVYNFQIKSNPGKEQMPTSSEDIFSDTIVEFNEKLGASSGFQEDMQKSLLKLLEQLMILEHKASPYSSANEKDQPTHNRKPSESRAARIRFQPPMSTLKYSPNVLIPSQPMFLAAIQAALQQPCKAHLHSNWLTLVESTLPFAGRSLTRLVVCVVSQLCHNLEAYSDKVAAGAKFEPGTQMPPNYLLSVLKSLATLCHFCLLDPSSVSTPPLSPQAHSSTNPNASAPSAANPLQLISNFFHVWSNVEVMSEANGQNSGTGAADPLISTRRTVLSHLPRILAAVLNIWKACTIPESSYQTHGWEVMGNTKDVKQKILEFLSPISIIHGTNFMGAVAVVWYDLRDPKLANDQRRTVIPICSQDQSLLVNLIAAIRVLPMDIVLKTVQHVMKQPPQTTHARKKRVPLEVCMLQFFLAYIRVFPGSQLLECWKSLLALLKDGLQVSSAQPLAQFHLLAILHEFVQAAPLIEDRKDQKDLQDVAQKLVDACTTVAGARLGQTRWLRRNLEVKPGPQQDALLDEDTDGDFNEPSLLQIDSPSHSYNNTNGDDNSFLAKFSVQALNALAEFVAPVLDVVYISEEKEKVVPLVSNIMYYVTPYLRNHSKHNGPSFKACSHLLSSISGYQYSRKAWRKDAFELLLEPAFFQMEASCFASWKIVVDHLMTHDKTTFRDFLSRMSINQTGSLKIFSSKDQENEQRANLAKRLAFILFCSEKDQYQRYMPEIQEKLIECLRVNSAPIVQSQILLCFRVLLLRMSHHHLTSLWPFIYTEMFQTFLQIESDLVNEAPDIRRSQSGSHLQKFSNFESSWTLNHNNGLSVNGNPALLMQYLYACKLLDLAMALPAEFLPQFQMYRWAFVGDPAPPDVSPVQEDRSLLNHLNNNINQDSLKSPSPTPSRTSSTSSVPRSGTPCLLPLLPIAPFEPHIIRIEKCMSLKSPAPTLLPYTEGKPLLQKTAIKSLLELHPFFYTLMKVSQPNSSSSLGEGASVANGASHRSAEVSSNANGSSSMEDVSKFMDSIVELDFLEEPSND